MMMTMVVSLYTSENSAIHKLSMMMMMMVMMMMVVMMMFALIYRFSPLSNRLCLSRFFV